MRFLLDFELRLTNRGQPLSTGSYDMFNQKYQLQKNYEKLALLAAEEKFFPVNSKNMKGQYHLKVRELEMLGYRVIVIPYYLWYSMELSQLQSKKEYMSNLLWPDR